MNTPDPTFPPLPLYDPTVARVLGATASGTGVRLNLVSEIGTEFSYSLTNGVTAVTVDGKPQELLWVPDGVERWVEAFIKYGGRIDVRLHWDETDITQKRILLAEFTATTGGK